MQQITEVVALGPFATIWIGNFDPFLGLHADLAHAFLTLVEDKAVEVAGRVANGQFRLDSRQVDGADEVEPVLLIRKYMLKMRTDR